MLKGKFLPEGKALEQYTAFWGFTGNEFLPHAVCYKLDELLMFYNQAKQTLEADGVPESERGVALMLGLHLDPSSSHAHNKPTIMMVATQWVDNADPKAGKVDSINNPILQEGWTALAPPPPIKDTSYDAGSLWP